LIPAEASSGIFLFNFSQIYIFATRLTKLVSKSNSYLMAFDEFLADRIRIALKEKKARFTEKKMMGGLACMVDDKMCVGVIENNMMARIDPEVYEKSITRPGCRPMDFTGRPMKGWIYLEPEAIDMDKDLNEWVQLALDYNPKAKSSKKKK